MNMDIINAAIAEIRETYQKQQMGARVGYGKKPVVLVIDFQKVLADPSRDAGGDMSKEINNTRIILDKAREKGIRIIYTVVGYEDDAFDGGVFTQKLPTVANWKLGTDDLDVAEGLGRQEGEHVIIKKYASAFFGTGLASFLTAGCYDTIIMTGCSTSGCIRASAIDACSNGFRTIIPRDCVNDRNPLTHEVNLMDMDTRYADVVEMDSVLEYLDKF